MTVDRGSGIPARHWSPLVGGAGIAAAIFAFALAAPWLAPFSPERQLDPAVGRMLPPGSSRYVVTRPDGSVLLAEAVERVDGGWRIRRGGERRVVPSAEILEPEPGEPPPRRRFLLGTDTFGRDVLSRLLYGARVSLWIGCLAALLAVLIGVGLGATAGFAGGWVDGVLMRIVDALLAFPRLFLVIALAALFESTGLVLVLVLGLTGWMGAARLTRSRVRSLRRREFVEAARAVGQRPREILRRHLLPHALTPVLIDTALRVGDIILVEAALSFLGMGVQTPTATWGGMVAEGATQLPAAWWISTVPGLAIALTVVALHLIADGLRDALDPRRSACQG